MKGLVICLLLFGQQCFSQAPVAVDVKAYFSKGINDAAIKEELLAKYNQSLIGKELLACLGDSTVKHQELAISFVKFLEKKSSNPLDRKTQLSVLFKSIETLPLKDSKACFDLFVKYSKDLFTAEQVDLVRDYISLPKVDRKQAFLILGYLGQAEDADFLNALATVYDLSKEEKYYMQLAQVRLKQTAATAAYLEKFNAIDINDAFVTNTLKDAIYTRNETVIQRLLKECLSDALNCYSANNDANVKIPCAYRIIEQVAPVIYNFPVKIDRIGEISGNPEEELQKMRSWYNENNTSIIILETTF